MILHLIAVFICWVAWKIYVKYNQSPCNNFGTSAMPILRNSINMCHYGPEKMFSHFREAARRFNNTSYQAFLFRLQIFNIVKAEDAEKLLISSVHIEKSFVYNFLHSFLKTGLLTSKGEKWRLRRRMLTPAFHFEILKEFYEVFNEESNKLVETLSADTGKVLDIVPVSTQFTLNTICESAMGVKLSKSENDGVVYRLNIHKIGRLLVHRIMRPWLHWDALYAFFGERKKVDVALEPVHDFTKSIIKERKANFMSDRKSLSDEDNGAESTENIYFRSKKRRFAMMDTLLQAQQAGLIDDEGIIEETDTFTFAGHDTTSAAMTFTLLLLAHHPEAQERVFEEIQEALYTKDDLTVGDFNKMEYLDRVVKESLRIYPPVPLISRKLSEDFILNGITHPKDTTFHVHIFDIHRDPENFPDPEKFDPDRFLPDNCESRNKFAFVAFSAGMRNCIGQRFAMLELKVILAKVIKCFKVSPVTRREDVVFLWDMVLRPRDPVKMRFQLRNSDL